MFIRNLSKKSGRVFIKKSNKPRKYTPIYTNRADYCKVNEILLSDYKQVTIRLIPGQIKARNTVAHIYLQILKFLKKQTIDSSSSYIY